MIIACRKLLLKLTLHSLCIQIVLTQRLPPNNCGNLFRYERLGNQWIGHVTQTQNPLTDVTWKLRFVGNEPGKIGRLEAYPNRETLLQRMRDGGRPESFVRFEGYQNELPKIVRLEINGQVLCTASESGTSTNDLQLQLSVSSTKSSGATTTPPATSSTEPTQPAHGCGNIFKYERLGNQYIGHVTSPSGGNTDYKWKLVFSTRGEQSGTVGELSSYPNKEANFERIRKGGRAESYVIFNVKQGVLPKIVSIELNEEVLCTSTKYEAPAMITTVTLHTHVDKSQDAAPEECGMEGLGFLQIGGQAVTRGHFPWLAALYHNNNVDKTGNLQYKCVSTLISKRTVITAAHCIHGIPTDRLWVYVGRHDLHTHPENNATLMSVKSVLTPPDFATNPQPDLDVGLLVLTNPVQYSIYVRPICLWSSSSSLVIPDSEKAAVAGWGLDEKFQTTRFPMEVNVKPVSREECLRQMPTAKDYLTPRTLCAGNSQGHGPCLGDSGGGLMVLRNNRWMVRGIVSKAQRAGNGCDLTKFVIYCDVAKHLTWIEQNIVR